MTPEGIIALLFLPVDKARILKAQGLAQRSKLMWEQVLAAMTPEQRKAVDDASQE